MNGMTRDKAVVVTLITLGLFIAGRFLGMGPLASAWSFAHWSVLPVWIIGFWLAAVVLIYWLLTKVAETETPGARWFPLIALPVLLVLFYLLRFDSFAFGGGNLRVADIGQTTKTILRWFEFLAVGGVALLYKMLRNADIPTMEAATSAWAIRSFLAGVVASMASLTLGFLLADRLVKRIMLALISLFGGHTLMFLGYTGVEQVIPPLVIWFAVASVFYSQKPSIQRLAICWGIAIASLAVLFSLVILLPAALALTAHYFLRKSRRSLLPMVIGVVALSMIVMMLYSRAGQTLELASLLLFPASKKPFLDYGLFSVRHLVDWLQLLFLGAPFIPVVKYLGWKHLRSRSIDPAVTALIMVTLGGLAASFIFDPVHSILLDAPRLMAYLTPIGALLAILLAILVKENTEPSKLLPITAVSSIAVFLAIVPVYHSIALADRYALPYLDRHGEYYISASFSFRDAYFQKKEFDNARRWESSLPAKSPDYFLLRGSDNLRMNGNYAAAAEEQFKIVTKFPFWTEPRAMLAVNQMSLGRYQLAKAHIDTCLMLEPFKRTHHVNLYSYYRDVQDWPNAVRAVAIAENISPGDIDIRTDRMIILYRANDLVAAEVMADELLERDSLLPFPYLIKGFLADRGRNNAMAIQLYEKFLELAPKEPESPKIQERVNALKNPQPLPEE